MTGVPTTSGSGFDDPRCTGGNARRRAEWPTVGSFRYLMEEDRWEWSDAVARMHGYEPGTVSPTTELIVSHKHPADRNDVARLIEQVRRHGQPFSSRHRIIDTGGKVHVVVVVADRLIDDAGDIAGTSGFYVDITDGYESDLQHTLDVVLDEITRNRSIISQAVGMLRLVYDVSEERAFTVLRWLSSQSNTKMRDIAARLVGDVGALSIVSPSGRTAFDHLLLSADRRGGS